ncbi:MAG: response regulator transcription factor [Sphingobacteriaceae bacterium]|nr:response regulator transcription factor [Sphingobacteriaceae bacterium]
MREQAKILLIDDEPDILVFMKFNLQKEGYKVETAISGKEGVSLTSEFKPDLIVLDVMMPEMDGFETCMQLRKNKELNNTFIVFLTASGEDNLQVKGFEAGADDYIHKPIKIALFIKRVQALLKRKNTIDIQPREVSVGGVTIDHEKYSVAVHGKEIFVTKKEYELLTLLMSEPGKIFSRQAILVKLWGAEFSITDRTIDVHIRKLREKLGENHIKTLKGEGYTFDYNNEMTLPSAVNLG